MLILGRGMRWFGWGVAGAIVLVAIAPAQAGQWQITKVVDTNTTLPGLGGQPVRWLDLAALQNGRVIFGGGIDEPSASPATLWSWSPSEGFSTFFSAGGQPLPGGRELVNVTSQRWFEGDDFAFIGERTQLPGDEERSEPFGVYLWRNGQLQVVADPETPRPNDRTGEYFRGLSYSVSSKLGVFLSDGEVLFSSPRDELSGGLFRWSDGALTRLVDELTPPPGASRIMNPAAGHGRVVFGGSGFGTGTALLSLQDGEVSILVQEGDSAPDSGFRAIFDRFSPAQPLGPNATFFDATVAAILSPGDTPRGFGGLYVADGNGVRGVVTPITPVPGLSQAELETFRSIGATSFADDQAAFVGIGTRGARGVYVVGSAPGSLVEEVIGPGDLLDGIPIPRVPVIGSSEEPSYFVSLVTVPQSFDGRSLVFASGWSGDIPDGRPPGSGIFLATWVPEPSGWVQVVLALVIGTLWRLRRALSSNLNT